MASTSYISGMASGLDWQTMISQLMQIERQPEKILEGQKSDLNERYSEWTKVNTLLSSFKTAVSGISSADDFNLYTSNAHITGSSSNVDTLLKYAVGTNASEGTYNITVNNVATAQKISSKGFSSISEALGMAGDVIINGRTLSIAGTDSLSDIRTKINAMNSGTNPAGVTASIISVSEGEYRLTLTSKTTGSDGMYLANGSGTDILSQLDLANDALTLRNAVAGGARSEAFSSSTDSLGSLLGLTGAASGSVSIAGIGVSIDLANDSLQDIRDRINGDGNLQAAGVSASIVTSTVDGKTVHALQIDGTQSFEDSGNILQTMGILKQGYSHEIVAGQDAEIILDGFTITRKTNQISDVISGVTLNLLAEDENATITLDISRDYDGIKEKIKGIVDSYNKVMSYIADQNTASGDGKTTKPLYADSSLQTIKSTLRSVILSGVSGLDSPLDHLSFIGINIDKTGQLSINNDKLDGYLKTNFDDVMNLFIAQGSSSSSNLTYIASSRSMLEGSYDVEVTQAATRASVIGSGFSGTLSSDATLSLTSSDGTEQSISLSAGWDIDSIVNAINSGNTLGVTAQNDGGQLRISNSSYGSSGFTVSVTGGSIGIGGGTYTGLDVAGRIRAQGSSDWMTMTGKGQILTGDSGQEVKGLAVRYTGTGTGMLDFTFIKGIGEKLDQALYSMSDSLSGYVTTKQKSLQNQMQKIDRKIEDMEARLSKYEETLMAKYTAMEKLLSQMQSQQSWLTSQINSLSTSWG